MSEGGYEVDKGDYFGTEQNMEFKRERAEKEEEDKDKEPTAEAGEKHHFEVFLAILGIPTKVHCNNMMIWKPGSYEFHLVILPSLVSFSHILVKCPVKCERANRGLKICKRM